MFLVMIALINILVFSKLIYEVVLDILDCWKFSRIRKEVVVFGLWSAINIFLSILYICLFIFLA